MKRVGRGGELWCSILLFPFSLSHKHFLPPPHLYSSAAAAAAVAATGCHDGDQGAASAAHNGPAQGAPNCGKEAAPRRPNRVMEQEEKKKKRGRGEEGGGGGCDACGVVLVV